MKRLKELFYCALATLMFTGCQSYKKVPYLQDAEVVLYSTQNEQLYDAKIMPKDLLTIVVSCTSPELAAPFNLTVATQNNAALNYTTTQPVLQQYLVDNDGNITDIKLRISKTANVAEKIKFELRNRKYGVWEDVDENYCYYTDKILGVGSFKAWLRNYGSSVMVMEPISLAEEMYDAALKKRDVYLK